MAYSRASVPELENLLKYGKKKFVMMRAQSFIRWGFILFRSWQSVCCKIKM